MALNEFQNRVLTEAAGLSSLVSNAKKAAKALDQALDKIRDSVVDGDDDSLVEQIEDMMSEVDMIYQTLMDI
jgi:hypothetical protein